MVNKWFFFRKQEILVDDEMDKENSQPTNDAGMRTQMSSTPIDKKRRVVSPENRTIKLLECKFCDASFKKKKWLTEHMVKFHAIKRGRLGVPKRKHSDSTDDNDETGRFVYAQVKRSRAANEWTASSR